MKYSLPYIIYEVTPRCNLNCRYCYNIWKIPGAAQPSTGSYTNSIKVLRRLFKMAEVKHVTFTGGEPFLSERFEELVLWVRMKRKGVTLITNGSGASDEQYQNMVKLGVDLFEIPIHSREPEIHDDITRVPGSWKNSVRSVRFLRSLGVHVVPVVVISKMNAKLIKETLEFIAFLGPRQIMLNRYNIGGEGFSQAQELLTTHRELREAYAVANELAPRLGLKLSSNVCTPQCLLNPKDYRNIAFGNCSTNVQHMPITLDMEGNIRLCNHSPVVAGNIFEKNFEEIFHSEHMQNWLKECPDFCKDCELYENCLGGCRAAALQCGLGMNEVDPIMTFPGLDV